MGQIRLRLLDLALLGSNGSFDAVALAAQRENDNWFARP
jgi:hypothetical protein